MIRSGYAEVRVRIDEVSRCHMNQAFMLRVGPDTAASASLESSKIDVAPVFSPPVTVRSKRSRRKQGHSDGAAAVPSAQSEDPPAHVPTPGHDPGSVCLSGEGNGSGTGEGGEGGGAVLVDGESQGAQEALGRVLTWIDATLKAAQFARWAHLGFERRADGTPDSSKPLYR